MDAWLATGPATGKAIRTFFVRAKKVGANGRVEIGHCAAKGRPVVPQEQRLAGRREPLRQHLRNRRQVAFLHADAAGTRWSGDFDRRTEP
ncbi:hypothetical protein GCM10023081_29200 [Arthrobacter ginkgonis]|uniref:Transposase n=1 Tax=Arthrobacter ginkgonis TaxID=1630594 RepID=A0ABP7CJA0_9MICC